MKRSIYWADSYVEKQRTAEAAIAMIRPGKRVYVGSASGEPQALVRALSAAAIRISGLEIVRLMSRETTSLSEIADKTRDHSLNIRTIYLGSADTEAIARYMRFITPINMSEVPGLFLSRKLPIHVALIQVSPPDDFGWMSLGVSVDVTLAAAQSADLVIAQVNPKNAPHHGAELHSRQQCACAGGARRTHFVHQPAQAIRAGRMDRQTHCPLRG